MIILITLTFILYGIILRNEIRQLRKELMLYKTTESEIKTRMNADALIDGIKDHFNIYNTLKNIPFIVWWLKDVNGNIIKSSTNLEVMMKDYTKSELDVLRANCKISDRYITASYNTEGTRRAMAFYEIINLGDKSKLWQVIKICIPVEETDNSKINIFSLAIMHDRLHGSFKKARERLAVLEAQNMVCKVSDTVFINKSKGDY
jgi:hypothetical protein